MKEGSSPEDGYSFAEETTSRTPRQVVQVALIAGAALGLIVFLFASFFIRSTPAPAPNLPVTPQRTPATAPTRTPARPPLPIIEMQRERLGTVNDMAREALTNPDQASFSPDGRLMLVLTRTALAGSSSGFTQTARLITTLDQPAKVITQFLTSKSDLTNVAWSPQSDGFTLLEPSGLGLESAWLYTRAPHGGYNRKLLKLPKDARWLGKVVWSPGGMNLAANTERGIAVYSRFGTLTRAAEDVLGILAWLDDRFVAVTDKAEIRVLDIYNRAPPLTIYKGPDDEAASLIAVEPMDVFTRNNSLRLLICRSSRMDSRFAALERLDAGTGDTKGIAELNGAACLQGEPVRMGMYVALPMRLPGSDDNLYFYDWRRDALFRSGSVGRLLGLGPYGFGVVVTTGGADGAQRALRLERVTRVGSVERAIVDAGAMPEFAPMRMLTPVPKARALAQPVTRLDEADAAFRLSPDGLWMARFVGNDASNAIIVSAVHSPTVQLEIKREGWRVYTCPNSWSPDGTRLVILAVPFPRGPESEGQAILVKMNQSDGYMTQHDLQLPQGAKLLWSCAAWSPDGERFVVDTTGQSVVMDRDGAVVAVVPQITSRGNIQWLDNDSLVKTGGPGRPAIELIDLSQPDAAREVFSGESNNYVDVLAADPNAPRLLACMSYTMGKATFSRLFVLGYDTGEITSINSPTSCGSGASVSGALASFSPIAFWTMHGDVALYFFNWRTNQLLEHGRVKQFAGHNADAFIVVGERLGGLWLERVTPPR